MSDHYFLKSKRIGFRPWTLHDIDFAIELWQDDNVMKFTGGALLVSKIHKRITTEKAILRLHNIQCWPIFLIKTGEYIGSCGLRPYNPHKGIYEIDIYIKSSLWGNGYAAEAAKAVIIYAFDELGAAGIFAAHHPEDVASKALLTKLRFRKTHDEFFETTGLQHPSYVLNKK